jgi:glucose-6-phosphate 1-dehydrogenase
MDCTIIILGVTGDLTRKKLIPAIYNLQFNKKLEDFAIIGIGRRDFKTDELLNDFRALVENTSGKTWNRFRERFYYFRTNFYDESKFKDLGDFVKSVEQKSRLSGNRLFYLATMPQHFQAIVHSLSKYKLVEQKDGWARVVFEKPFGEDLASARKLNSYLKKVFEEKQIYRIDHYLGKELVQNITALRFTNTILEPLWNKDYVDHVQIILSENFGIEERGVYYDRYGALKDVVQNHMMQLLCLVAMEAPFKLGGEYMRDEKVKVLKSIGDIDRENVVLGQYEGYREEPGVREDSNTETLVALKLYVDNERWRNVPFYLITGKKMKDKVTSIYVQFRQPPCLLFDGVCDFLPNYLVIQIQPEEGFYLQLNAKSPGKFDVSAVKMDFCHKCTFGPNTPEAYENLLLAAINGDQSVFIRSDEIEEAWRVIDKITKKKPALYPYRLGSYPEQVKKLIEKDKRCWHLMAK